MKYNKVKITKNGLQIEEFIHTANRPETEVNVFYATDSELQKLAIGEVSSVSA